MFAVTDGSDEELRHEPGVDRVLSEGLHLPVRPGVYVMPSTAVVLLVFVLFVLVLSLLLLLW